MGALINVFAEVPISDTGREDLLCWIRTFQEIAALDPYIHNFIKQSRAPVTKPISKATKI